MLHITPEIEEAYKACATPMPLEELVIKSLKQQVTLLYGPGPRRLKLLKVLGFVDGTGSLLTTAGLNYLLNH